MLLSWSAPVSGGQPIKFYRIQKQVGGSGDYSPVVENGIIMEDTGNTNVERQITGLHPGTLYAFKVQAVNSVGNGEFSKRSEPIFTAKRSGTSQPFISLGLNRICILQFQEHLVSLLCLRSQLTE